MNCQVIFQPSGRRGAVTPGKSLLEAARELGAGIESPCGSMGQCGKCRIKLETGFFPKYGIESGRDHLSPVSEEERQVFSAEELAAGYRLACQARVCGDALVFIPEESRGANQVVLEQGAQRRFELKPAVRAYHLSLESRGLGDDRGDWEFLKEALLQEPGLSGEIGVDYFVLTRLAAALRQNDGEVTVWVWQGREVIDIRPGCHDDLYGVAIDVGTTTVAAYLCDLCTGRVAATASLMNPQVRYGEDVLSRITYARSNPDGLETLNRAIIEGLNRLISSLACQAGLAPRQVVDLTLVFNTAMHHIALNLEPQYLGCAPYLPAVKEPLDLRARDLGIDICQGARVYIPPVEAGFIGADNMAVIIAEEPYNSSDVKLIIDIGTNGEIVLGSRQFLASTSCATGPALEGAQITFGMRAAEGAIERVRIDPGTLEVDFRVIGNDSWSSQGTAQEARGICGSGIIDAVAELFKAGVITRSGRFDKNPANPRLRRNESGKMEFVLAWAPETAIGQDITITQGDVRAVQLAKAALYTGAKYLMEKFGVASVGGVILAGAFGSYINRENALAIGMFPDCDPERITAVGNAAGDGAKLVLLDTGKRDEASQIARRVHCVETSMEPDFQARFVEAMAFPHARDSFLHWPASCRQEQTGDFSSIGEVFRTRR
jgi:uncharacterized 2Fe-2S/4Fe-4S cluster protein (DUF4445 family)